MQKIAVIGAGAWGTALAATFQRAGSDICLWAREKEVADSINVSHENTPFLPGFSLHSSITAVTDFADLPASDAIVLAVPAQFIRPTTLALAPFLPEGTPVIVCAKGIEIATGALLHDILAETLPTHPIAILSGPTFAAEVAYGTPTALTLACKDEALGKRILEAISTPTFRPYYSDDIIGVEVGGAVKNVLAIASGIVEGKKFGDNARAALITRGLAEMGRLATALGGKAETLRGLSGVGDAILTATSTQSRNYSLGVALGKGQTLAEYRAGKLSVAEGAYTAEAVVKLAASINVDMPICMAVNAVLKEEKDVNTAINELLSRPLRTETDDAS